MNVKTGFWSKINRIFWWIAAVAIIAMCLTTTMDVFWRWLTNKSIGPVYSLCETLMALMVWSAVSPTQEAGKHINVTLLTSRLSDKKKVILEILSLLLCAFFFALLFWKTLEDGLWAYGVKSYRAGDFYRFPTWWARLFVPVGIAAMLGQLAFEIINNFRILTGTVKAADKANLLIGREEAVNQ